MGVTDTLVNARSLIEQGWTQRTSARDKDGMRVYVLGPHAVEFCSLGALQRATDVFDVRLRCVQLLCQVAGDYNLGRWNDRPERTKEEVLAAFDTVIAERKNGKV